MSKRLYTNTDIGRLGAEHHVTQGSVYVWRVNGPQLGGYNIDRFEGGKLTPASLRKLFEKPDPEPWEGHPNAPVDAAELDRLIAEDANA